MGATRRLLTAGQGERAPRNGTLTMPGVAPLTMERRPDTERRPVHGPPAVSRERALPVSRERPNGDKRGGRRGAFALALLPALLGGPALAQETPDPSQAEPAPSTASNPLARSPSEPATAGR
ncbi:hypothetical protein MetexDRAFT_5590, partial [Methylorubrum extorquens DSM 13060]